MKVITNISPAHCNGCGWVGVVADLNLATGLQTRLDEGADYTPFECPKCGALVYNLSDAKTSGKKMRGRQEPKT